MNIAHTCTSVCDRVCMKRRKPRRRIRGFAKTSLKVPALLRDQP
jgi:hypothetical protein